MFKFIDITVLFLWVVVQVWAPAHCFARGTIILLRRLRVGTTFFTIV